MFDRIFKTISKIVTVVAVIVSFLLAMELIRAYQTLRDLHPWAGYAFVGLLVVGLVWLVGRLMGGWRYTGCR